jgi:DNA replicative helicase MCM subunit Mcm2 (Cdc46/Mcm family)
LRLICWICHKSVSNEVSDETVFRAIAICPECIEQNKVIFVEDDGTKES